MVTDVGGRRCCAQMSMAERRARNRSLSSILCTPPAYPGYTSCLGSIVRGGGTDSHLTTFSQYGETMTSSALPHPSMFSRSMSHSRAETRRRFEKSPSGEASGETPPLCSPEDDTEFQSDLELCPKEKSPNASASSGYGSAASESDPDCSPNEAFLASEMAVEARSRSAKYKSREEREAEKWRRRSVPASLRNALPDDVIRILRTDGHCNYETDVDSGDHLIMEVRGIRRPESVMQLARRFGEIGAAQQNDLHKSRNSLWDGKENTTKTIMSKSGPTTPVKQANLDRVGGIASLRVATTPKMSRPNMFKQMEKVGATTAGGPVRPMNPNSIKDALLRWCQSRVQGYPNVSVTNFSSSWADGMAFCALIHRFAPESFDFRLLDPNNRRHNLELAFKVAEDHGVCALLEVDDMLMMGDRPDWKCVFTYVQGFYKQFRERP